MKLMKCLLFAWTFCMVYTISLAQCASGQWPVVIKESDDRHHHQGGQNLQDGISRRSGSMFRKREGHEENQNKRKSCAGWCLRLMSTAMIGLIKD